MASGAPVHGQRLGYMPVLRRAAAPVYRTSLPVQALICADGRGGERHGDRLVGEADSRGAESHHGRPGGARCGGAQRTVLCSCRPVNGHLAIIYPTAHLGRARATLHHAAGEQPTSSSSINHDCFQIDSGTWHIAPVLPVFASPHAARNSLTHRSMPPLAVQTKVTGLGATRSARTGVQSRMYVFTRRKTSGTVVDASHRSNALKQRYNSR